MSENKIVRIFIISFIIINILLSFYIYYSARGGSSFCLAGESCLKVQGSKYGHIFGVPVSLLGLIAFSILLFVYIYSFKDEKYKKYFEIGALIGALFAVYFLSVQFFVLDMLCSSCLVVDSITIVIFILALFTAVRKLL